MLFGRAGDRAGCRFRQAGRVPTKFVIICGLLAIVERVHEEAPSLALDLEVEAAIGGRF